MQDEEKQKKTNNLYIILIISTVLSFVPFAVAQLASISLIIAVLIMAYLYRAKDSEDGLLFNHMTYLIRTIWIGSTFLSAGIIAAGIYVFLQGDHSLVQNAANQISAGTMFSENDLIALGNDYIMANKNVLILGTGVFVGPAILYFIYRIANGYSRAAKGYRIANPKSWL
jgi:uncharacterized membrane protein